MMYSQFVSTTSAVTRISRSLILKYFPAPQTHQRSYRAITRRFIKLTINPKKKSASKLNVKSESDIHLGAKNHIKEELSHTNKLSIARVCTTKQDLEHIAIAPFWTCSHMLVEKDWLKGFNKAETEYRMKKVGIPDVALLDRDTDKVVGLVEVLYTSKMSNSKIEMLNQSKIPWVETKAEDVMGWTGADPLIAYRSSEPDWQCNACKELNWQHVTLERIAAIVDVYPVRTGWSTKFYRKVFAIYQDVRALPNNTEELADRYYLVEGTYMVIDGWNIIECESFLRGAVQFSESYEKVIGKEPIFMDGLHFALNEDQAMILLKDLMHSNLNNWKQSPTKYSIDDSVLKWPGLSLRQMFHQKDHGTLAKSVSVNNYQSLPTLYPTIARLFGYNIPWLKTNVKPSTKKHVNK